MSETPPLPEDETPRDLAAEYVLGVLDAAERAQARNRLAADPHFAAAVAAWEARLSPLASTVGSVEPPPALWSRIEAALPPARPRAANDVRLWQGLAAAAIALAAACLAVLVWPRTAPGPAPALVAVLAPKTGPATVVASLDVERARLVLTATDLARLPGRSPELWIMPPGVKPISLGLVGAGQITVLPLARANLTRLRAGVPMAVSMEPVGGSPTGLPTGPVVALGEIRAL